MKNGICICNIGMETECCTEIELLLKQFRNSKKLTKTTITKKADGVCFITNCTIEELVYLSYYTQTVERVLAEITTLHIPQTQEAFDITETPSFQKEVEEKITMHSFSDFITREQLSFCTRVHSDSESYNTVELEKYIGGHIHTTAQDKLTVNLKRPDILFYCIILDNEIVITVDIAKKELSKREYRIFLHAQSIKATIATGLLFFAGYTPKQHLVDPCCGAGTILIEAALHATHTSPHFFSQDQFLKLPYCTAEDLNEDAADFSGSIQGFDIQGKYVDFTKKNAKIAGIQKALNAAKNDIDWLDIKCEEKSVDCIVTCPPLFSQTQDEAKLTKLYSSLFQRAPSVLTKKGTITILTNNAEKVKDIADTSDFELLKEKECYTGKKKMYFLQFR